jgi:DNA-binding beta-propeller fold protein YncE
MVFGRRAMLAGGLGVAAGLHARCATAQPQAGGALALVLNSGEASLSRVDLATRTELDRQPALREPHHIIRTALGDELIIGDSAANEFLFADARTGAVRRRLRVSNPYHLALSGDASALVVLSLRRDQFDLYDPADMRLVRRIALPRKPSHPAWSPDHRIAYATLQGSGEVAAVSVATQDVLWRTPVGREPAGIAWAPCGALVVGIMGADHVAVVNPDSGRVERRIVTGRGAHAVFPTPDRRNLVVTNRVAGTISVLDGTTLDELRRYDTPGGPDCLDFSPDGRELWYTRRWAQSVGVLDLDSGMVVATVPVGRSPHGIIVLPGAA